MPPTSPSGPHIETPASSQGPAKKKRAVAGGDGAAARHGRLYEKFDGIRTSSMFRARQAPETNLRMAGELFFESSCGF